MSNSLVGTVYQKIMDEVIENCVVTFEEDGVERKLLDEVKKTWQAKLSERKVANMPWDPAPAMPTSSIPGASIISNTVNPNARAQPQLQLQQPPGMPDPGSAQQKAPAPNAGGPHIKSEPGAAMDLQNLPPVPHPAPANGVTIGNNPNDALNRASQLIKEKYGNAASTQVNQLQARVAMNQAGQNNQNQPQLQQTSPQALDEQQRRKLYAQQQSQLNQQKMQNLQAQRQQQQSSITSSQTDGSADWSAMVAERRAAASAGGSQADVSLRERIELMARDMEGGGLMLPVSQLPKARKRRTDRVSQQPKTAKDLIAAQVASPSKLLQFDGPDDSDDDKSNVKDEDDEDAINSDLDDPDDDVPEEAEEDANQGEIMLCTYDKVQRVKNKWKCTLKDGVLTTGGKEYVFHKAQGEFEW